MIAFERNPQGELSLRASIVGLPVFLDQFAMYNLAYQNPSRRARFVGCINSGAEVLFSISNAAELSATQGDSFRKIRDFVNDIGTRWFPVELDPVEVINREKRGLRPDQCCACMDFMTRLLVFHSKTFPKDRVLGVSPELFNLRHVMDWIGPQRDSIIKSKRDMDAALVAKIKDHRAKHDADPMWTDMHFPELQFNPSLAGTFAYVNMVRLLVLESKSYAMKPNDGIDFCQAVIGPAFASVATLDKNWKRRVEALPKPNRLAPVYYAPELDKLVDDLEADLKVWNSRRLPSQLIYL